jgi:acetyl-CoA C-acetyltransferase
MLSVFDKDIYLLAASRTPIGRFNGRLAAFSAPELGGRAIEAALQRAAVQPAQVQMVTMGCVVTSGLGEAPAKQAALRAGIPDTVYSRTVESVCGSGMEALSSTIDVLLLGRVDVAVAGGMESRTNAPYLLEPRFIRSGSGYAKGERLRLKKSGAYRWQYGENSDQQLALSSIVDATAYDGLFWPVERKFMREYAVAFARKNEIALGDVNAHAALSHEKARTAWEKGYFEEEVVPLGDVSQDDLVTIKALDKMREEAAVDIACAYNTSTPADNGAAAVLATERFLDIDSPVRAVKMLLGELDGKVCSESQFEIFEFNEAFSIQLPVFTREFPGKKINVQGGAVALGHPFGSAGVRLLTTLVHAMKRLRIRYGAVGICFGSGGSYALAIEQLQAL